MKFIKFFIILFSNIEHTNRSNKKLILRSFLFGGLTIIGFALLEFMVQGSKEGNTNSFITLFPELLNMIKAASIMTFAELTVLWIRLASQPRVDVQLAAEKANESPLASSIVYFTHTLAWAFRVVVFIILCELI